jgi:hypothetical protein
MVLYNQPVQNDLSCLVFENAKKTPKSPTRGLEGNFARRTFENMKKYALFWTGRSYSTTADFQHDLKTTYLQAFCKHFRRGNFKGKSKKFSINLARRLKCVLSKFCGRLK